MFLKKPVDILDIFGLEFVIVSNASNIFKIFGSFKDFKPSNFMLHLIEFIFGNSKILLKLFFVIKIPLITNIGKKNYYYKKSFFKLKL